MVTVGDTDVVALTVVDTVRDGEYEGVIVIDAVMLAAGDTVLLMDA